MDKIKYREDMALMKEDMKDKDKFYMAYLPMRGGYYRGLSVDKKKTVEDYFPYLDVEKVKFKEKIK